MYIYIYMYIYIHTHTHTSFFEYIRLKYLYEHKRLTSF